MSLLISPPELRDDGLSNRKAIPPFAALRAFEAVGRLGGIRRAAQSLGLDHAVISRHLRSLESWIGIRLVDRAHAGGRMTAEGAIYHARIGAALAEIAGATADLTRSGGSTILNIWCVPGLASRWLLSRLGQHRLSCDDYDIEIYPSDRGADFSNRDIDGDIRFVMAGDEGKFGSGATAIELTRPPFFPVASPALLEQLPPIRRPADFLSAPLLHEDSQRDWRMWLSGNEIEVEKILPGPRLWHAHLTLDAALRGEGIALTNRFLGEVELANGRLVEIAVGHPVILGAYTLFCRKDRAATPAMIKFQRWLAQLLDLPGQSPVSVGAECLPSLSGHSQTSARLS